MALNQPPVAAVAAKMMIYSLKAPDGNTYEVEAPEGSTEQQLTAWLYALRPEAAVAKVTLREISPNEPDEADSAVKNPVASDGYKSSVEQLVTQAKSSLGVFNGNETVDRSSAIASTTIAFALSAVIIFKFYKKIIRPNFTSLQKVFGYIILICTANWLVKVINEFVAYKIVGLPIRENLLLSVSLSLALIPVCYFIIWLLNLIKPKTTDSTDMTKEGTGRLPPMVVECIGLLLLWLLFITQLTDDRNALGNAVRDFLGVKNFIK